MNRMPTNVLLTATAAFALALGVTGCGGADDDASTASVDSAEFAEAIPGAEDLTLSLDDIAGEAALTAEGALTGEPSRLRDLTKQTFEKVNGLMDEAHARVAELIEGTEPETFTEGNFECRRWDVDKENAHWRLTSCQKDKKNRHFAFALKGRPLDAGDDALVPVMAGEGKILARFDDKKRGHGVVGFNFDNLATLTGQVGPAGKVGIGFRAAGRVRQLNVGLKNFAVAGDETPVSALYRFKHIVGVGGRVVLLAHGDIVERDAETGDLIQGADDLKEMVRAVIAWNRGVGARAAALVCGGTVGEGQCERFAQCWKADGNVTQEEADEAGAEPAGNARAAARRARIAFAAAACPNVPEGIDDVEDAPNPEDFELPAGETPAEPGADPAEG